MKCWVFLIGNMFKFERKNTWWIGNELTRNDGFINHVSARLEKTLKEKYDFTFPGRRCIIQSVTILKLVGLSRQGWVYS